MSKLHTRVGRLGLVFLCLACGGFASQVAAQNRLYVVDDDGGPGVDFTTIQAAIDAASDGDTIEVRAGHYTGAATSIPAVDIDGKSLVLTALVEDWPSVARLVGISVKNLSSRQSVVLRGFYQRTDMGSNVTLSENQGPILFEDVTSGPALLFPAKGPGISITNCESVTLVRCSFLGLMDMTWRDPFPGLESSGSTVSTYACTILGNPAFSRFGNSQVGKAAVSINDGFLFDVGSTFTGGPGSSDGSGAGGVGPGGPGLLMGLGNPEVHLLDSILIGGPGGDGGAYSNDGPPGPPYDQLSGSLEFITEDARQYQLSSPVSGGAGVTVDYAGEPGDFVFSVSSLALDPLVLLPLGLLLPDFPIMLRPHGLTDNQGNLQAVIPLPGIPPGFALSVFSQGVAFDSNGATQLASPSFLTILP